MTLLDWFMIGAIVAKLLVLIPLVRSIRESYASIKRSDAILKQTKGGDSMGGKPSKGTRKDKRLKENQPKAKKGGKA